MKVLLKILEASLKAIGSIWGFVTRAISVSLLMAFALFVITVFFPDNVIRAIDIVKGLIG